MSWLKKLFSRKPPADSSGSLAAGPGGGQKNPQGQGASGTPARTGAAASVPALPSDPPSKGAKPEPWIAVFRAIRNHAEQAKVDDFVAALAAPENRKLFGTKKLSDQKEGLRQVSLDPKLVPLSEVESVAGEWFKRIAGTVKPRLSPGDYWGLSFVDTDGATRQLLMTLSPSGGPEAKRIRSAPGTKPVSEPLALASPGAAERPALDRA